ncbi:MAG TPA: D-alanyl-D-alanine carboxypeptidase/D-alanyl-D-alanine-endopeptidase [Caldimonas sp.]|jgi:D-alanyl-D-alanine carboxypeptidase/D-alanyl-D-alanine-endopeptidase (penicillin-binding protein 4)|nr:D-alanyl-D-alanine carboxypeptidase/D-alanyl-D-alanine-endopeptidase [Caldimonas sp.]HEX4234422.1 D-alanyl-D-alanine carboxypeptidase/D-alanyl-D-alanine-endopeptidase [Caldimonas sp.]
MRSPPSSALRVRIRRAAALAAAALIAVAAASDAATANRPTRPAAPAAGDTRALPRAVESALARGGLPRDAMVAWVQEVDAARPRLAWQADKAVNPASLMKLVTTFAGLELLGPAYTWSTPVWLQGSVTDGVLTGNVVIKGNGDPKLVLERMWLLLRRLQQAGIREIRGDIVLDRSAFVPGDTNPADFDGEPLRPYNAGADALLLNYRSVLLTFTPDPGRGVATIAVDPPLAGVRVDASVPLTSGACDDWRGILKAELDDPLRMHFEGAFQIACGEKVWPIAYADPKSYNARALAGLWAEEGGKLSGTVRDGAAPALTPSFELRSPALAEVIRDINKLSNNVMAQQLFLTLGATQRGIGTPEAAREVIHEWLKGRIGNAASVAVVSNGSGLSRDSRLSAALLGHLLQAAWSSAVMPELMSSLPVAGIDGTLQRAKGAPGRAHLKTGSLRDVVGVAGYVLADSGRRYVVVGIVNHANANAARPALEALAEWAASDAPALAPTGSGPP